MNLFYYSMTTLIFCGKLLDQFSNNTSTKLAFHLVEVLRFYGGEKMLNEFTTVPKWR